MARAARAAQVVNPKAQLFDIPSTDSSVVARKFVEVKPLVTGQIAPMEFLVGRSTEYIDLNASYFELTFRLQKADGTDLDNATNLFPGQHLAHTMIKQLNIYFNGVLITPQTDTYVYKAWFETLLTYTPEETRSVLRLQGTIPDAFDSPIPITANKLDSDTPHANYTALTASQKQTVAAMKKEKALYVGGVRRKLIFKPHSEAFYLKKFLPPQVEISIQFHFNNSVFFLNGVGNNGRLNAEDIQMSFHVCQVKLTDPLYNTLSSARSKGTYVNFAVVRGEVRQFPLPAGEINFDRGDLFQNRIPDRLYFGIVHANSFNGNIAYDPFAFQKFDLLWVKQIINGEEYPHGKTLQLIGDTRANDALGYFRFLEASGNWAKGTPSLIGPKQWGTGANCTIFAFNNVSSGDADSPALNPQRSGDVRLQFRLRQALGHVATVIIFGEFENVLEITKDGGVLYNQFGS